MGIGYSTRTNDVINRAESKDVNSTLRADSFGLYEGRVADRILRNIFRNNVITLRYHRAKLQTNLVKALECKRRDLSEKHKPDDDSAQNSTNSSPTRVVHNQFNA